MSDFNKFANEMQAHVDKMVRRNPNLFRVNVNGDDLWEFYLNSFEPGDNPIYIKRTEHDDGYCRNFIRQYGGLVNVDNHGNVYTIWDFEPSLGKYRSVAEKMSAYVKKHSIFSLFGSRKKELGTKSNKSLSESGKAIQWHHFYLEIDELFVTKDARKLNKAISDFNTSREVLASSVDVISHEALDTFIEISGQIVRGKQFLKTVETFKDVKLAYESLPESQKQPYTWYATNRFGYAVARLKNSAVGSFLIDLSEGRDLEEAVTSYEQKVNGPSYMRPKPIESAVMMKKAEDSIVEKDLMSALPRRFATKDDVPVQAVSFIDASVGGRLGGGTVFTKYAKPDPINPKAFDRVEQVNIEEFLTRVMPNANSVEILFESRLKNRMFSLIAPQDPDANPLFSWGNNFSWVYTGNLTDSLIKQNVKSAGGNVTAPFRGSLMWNHNRVWNQNDLDLHLRLKSNHHLHVCYRNKLSKSTGINLDVDIIYPKKSEPAVENIVMPSLQLAPDGDYELFVENFTYRGGDDGFDAEIEINGEITSFSYDSYIADGEKVQIALIRKEGDKLTIIESLNGTSSIKTEEVWGIETNQFVPVELAFVSPNYWDGNHGNKHFMFSLKGCVNPERPSGFFLEYLRGDLHDVRRALQTLVNKMRVEPSEEQVSGIGFSESMQDNFIAKVYGQTVRIVKVNI